ncbi:MAG: ribbon-helix-helix protein, CopG family [Gemmatimonadota bacterium]
MGPFRSLLGLFLTPFGLPVLAALDASMVFFLPLAVDVAVVYLTCLRGIDWSKMVRPRYYWSRKRMSKTAKISISLPADMLAHADRERSKSGESRSELFRRALEALFREKHREASVRRYVNGYVAEPESEFEVSSADAASREAWEEEDWG